MDTININGYTLKNFSKINIVLGKNGCGKSTMLRQVEQGFSQSQDFGKSKYITPERGGSLIYEAGVEQALTNDINWMPNERRKNLTPNFRQQSVAQYRRLKDIVLEEIEKEKREEKNYTFDLYVEKINSLLDNIKIKRHETSFKIFRKGSGQELNPALISSGESELVSLGIECLIFSKEYIEDKENILFLDEPDVHLHPDLQVRLMHFLKDLIAKNAFKVLIATHSTAILGALETYTETCVAFMLFDQKEIEFKPISAIYKKILPVFGAHPLSNVFNNAPVLLLEGEDDERIWQQVVRSSEGKIKVYPCSVGTLTKMNEYEIKTQEIIQSVYDNAKAFSLRDKDDGTESIDDLPPVIRMKLSCRNAENLLLTDDVLESLGTNWDELKKNIGAWIDKNEDHYHFQSMKKFKDEGYKRKDYDLKEIRNDLMGIIGSSKPWEVAVGQVIASLSIDNHIDCNVNGKMLSFLGEKVVKNILSRAMNSV